MKGAFVPVSESTCRVYRRPRRSGRRCRFLGHKRESYTNWSKKGEQSRYQCSRCDSWVRDKWDKAPIPTLEEEG